jgi:hypothetical protein
MGLFSFFAAIWERFVRFWRYIFGRQIKPEKPKDEPTTQSGFAINPPVKKPKPVKPTRSQTKNNEQSFYAPEMSSSKWWNQLRE